MSSKVFILSLTVLCTCKIVFGQNIAINTTGSPADATRLLEVTQTSAAANMVALYAIHSGATGAGLTGYGLQAIKTGGAGTNIAGYFSSTGSSGANYSIIIPNGGGNMGIGTLTPTAQLHIHNTGADASMRVMRNAGSDFYVTSQAANSVVGTASATDLDIRTNNTPGRIYIQSDGDVGVGTITPSEKLHLYGTSTGYRIEDASVAGNSILLQAHSTLGPLITSHTNSSGQSTYNGVSHQIEIGNTALIFKTSPATAPGGARTFTENMRMDNNGNLGIGTNSPGFPLDVVGQIRTSGTGFGGGVFFRNTTAVTGRTYSIYSNNAGQFVIGDEVLNVAKFGMNSGLTGDVYFANIGNFGISTGSPGDKLEVSGGNIKITNGSAYNGMLYSGDANWGFKIQRTAATDDHNVRMSYWPASGTRRAGIYNANASTWVFYADHNTTPNIIMNNISSVGIGTTNPDQSVGIDVESNKRILALLGNTTAVTATDGVSQAGLSVQAIFSPSANTSSVGFVNVLPQLAPTAGITIANAYGIKIGALQSGAGTITNGYGVYVDMLNYPFGTNRYSGIFLGGNVGIGTATPAYALDVSGTTSTCNLRYTSYLGACSDIRYKKNILPLTDALSKVLNIQGVNYFWKTEEFPEKKFSNDKQIGFIAQDIEKIYPEVVITDDNGYKSVDYSRLTPILVEAMKEQQKLIEVLTQKVAVMEHSLRAAGIPAIQPSVGQLSTEKK